MPTPWKLFFTFYFVASGLFLAWVATLGDGHIGWWALSLAFLAFASIALVWSYRRDRSVGLFNILTALISGAGAYFGSHDQLVSAALAAIAAGVLIVAQLAFGHRIDKLFARVDARFRRTKHTTSSTPAPAAADPRDMLDDNSDGSVRTGLIIIGAVAFVSVTATLWLRGPVKR